MRWQWLLGLCACPLLAQQATPTEADLSTRPQPLEVKEFRFPSFTEHRLRNGLKVFIIEDHEQPTVTLRLQIGAGEAHDDIPGTAYLTALMLTKGAGKRSAQQIAATIDGVGAELSASATGDFTTVTANTLKKHLKTVLEIFADVALRPTFPAEELEKLRPQVIAEIRQERARPASLAQALARMVVYGEHHPYARRRTEQSIQQIRTEHLRRFHERYYCPTNATLAVVGDITPREILPLLEQALSRWQRCSPPELQAPPPRPMPAGIYFVRRPASVQSSIVVTAATVPFNHPDYEALDVLAELLGSGFGGRLFRSLRETYAYTYAPFAFLTQSRLINRIAMGAEVRNAVTDSALLVLRRELERIADLPPDEAELERIKRTMIGSYLRSFERTDFVASLLQRAELYGIPFERLRTYPERIQAISRWQVRDMAQRYLRPEALRTVVVGAPEVLPKLEPLGKVYEYTQELAPATNYEAVSLSVEELLRRYTDALGGAERIAAVQSVVYRGRAQFQLPGNLEANGEFLRRWKAPNKLTYEIRTPYFQQRFWQDGTSAWVEISGVRQQPQGRDLEKQLLESSPFYVTQLPQLGYKCQILGRKGGSIVLRAEPPFGGEQLYYFNASSYLLERAEKLEPSPAGDQPVTEHYSDYADIEGIRLPRQSKIESPWFTLQLEGTYELNVPIEDSEFAPPAE
jgi:predicted Zn-dependent peptidase